MSFKFKEFTASAKKAALLLIFILFTSTGFARTKSDFEVAGDILQILLPISTATTNLYLQDYEGLKQFSYAFGSTLSTTYILKYTINRERPDGTDHSFPSGHTSASFSAASFIHFRYGWKKAIPSYLVASYVGYSRVRAERHYQSDVYAGAAISVLFSYLFAKSYTPEDVILTPMSKKSS